MSKPLYTNNRRPRNARAVLCLVLLTLCAVIYLATHIDIVKALSITTLGTPITQNFDSLATSGLTNPWTDDTTLPGWYSQFELVPANPTTYRADAGGSNTGAIYSYGTGTATERAFGTVASGTPGTIFNAFKLTNNSGSTITSFDISFTGEQWRNGGNTAAHTLDFQYQVVSPGTITDANTPSTGWTDFDSLDFVSPIVGATAVALDGNAAANRTAKAANLAISVINGQEIWLRWKDINDVGNDHALAIDDLSVTPNGVAGTPTPTPAPALSINDVTLAEGDAGTTTFIFTVSLSSPALAGGVSFNVDTADGTTNPANAGTDYVAIAGGSGSISQGNSSTTVSVTVNGDTTSEPNETFFVNLSTISGATAADVQGLGTITNDDITIVPIHSIQGSGTASPFDAQVVTTTGIVTLLRTGTNNGGAASSFFIQTPDADVDADPNTSQGLLVFTSSVPTVAVGDLVNVTGTVDEFFDMTEITAVTNVSVISTGNTLPAAITLTPTILDPTAAPTQPQLEKYEGMRMSAASLTVVAPNDNFFDVFTVITGVPRPLREPGIEASLTVPPDPTTGLVDCCIPRWDENPERILVDTNARAGAPLNAYTSNVVLSNVAGPLDFSFSEYRLIPEATPGATANLSAVPVPVPTASEFTVAGYNIENFNNNATQRQKSALAIRDVLRLPHIIGVAEIFDLADLQALAVEINAISPGRTYQAHLVEADGTSEDSDQDVGYLVDTSRVTVNSVVQRNATETYTNPNNGQPELLNDRPPLVLTARVDPSGANLPVIVVVNHLRSFIDIELLTGDGPRVRAKRKAQAESLAALLQEYQTNNPTTSVISVGDYNAYEFSDGYTDPMATIKGNPTPDDQIVVDASPDLVNPNFVNLVDGLVASERYSFIFEGTPQALDHVIVNTVANARNTRFVFARMNADFPEVPAAIYVSNAARPERNSDHDAAVAYFNVVNNNTPPVANAQSVTTAENTPVAITLTGSDANGDPLTFTIVSGPSHGSLNPGTAGASQTYTPTAGFSGADSFTFKVNDGTADSAPATVSITVNDGGTLQFNSATYSVSEGGGNATITISRTGGSAGTASVVFSTSNGTAGSGDYTSVSETVVFNDGDLSKTVSVPITNDLLPEADETVNLALTVPGGSGQLGSPVTAVLTIQDDDPAGGIIRFSSATYDTTESSGSTSITVERVGDTSLAATVDYATQDDSGAPVFIPCATINGLASSRCDFTTALGTLRFAAGESSKTFTVFISQDNFVEGLETLSLTLSNPTGSSALGTPSFATLRITDDVGEPVANPIDDTEVFVRQHYHDFLNREADAAGLAFWINEIDSCGADAGCREVKRINVSAAFFLSIEFQESGNFVRNFYVAALNRPNNLPRYLEFMRDTQEVQRGVIFGQPNALTVLEANKQAFALDFVTRAEFVGLYPTSATPAQYVDALYLHAGVTPTSAERQAAIDEFGGAGTSADSAARARALRRVIQNSAFIQREFPRAFVQMQYFGYLRRNPDDQPDGNLDGYNFWLTKLNQFNGNFIQAEMVKAFISSSEYRNRFGQ